MHHQDLLLEGASPEAGAPCLDSETWVIEPPKRPGAPSIAPLSPAMGRILNIVLAVFALLLPATTAQAQWEIEDSHTTASLRGIHNVGGGIAWASGSNGTLLRTTDDGKTWQACPIPLIGTKDTAEKLDFRGIQAFDENTAIVMSSGPGDQSRLYKTIDGCQTWKLIFTNPDKDGFWDAIKFDGKQDGVLLGDPVNGRFAIFVTSDGGLTWKFSKAKGLDADEKTTAIFAASNSSLVIRSPWHRFFVTGGIGGSDCVQGHPDLELGKDPDPPEYFRSMHKVPLASLSASAGGFSVADAAEPDTFVAVGGDYLKPDDPSGTAAFSNDDCENWSAAKTPPHGYRSAVAYDPTTKTWITVGPNGTDISTDDGRNWRPLTPGPGDDKDADKNWNALSLPFVVGPKGRIGKLRPTALAPVAPSRQVTP